MEANVLSAMSCNYVVYLVANMCGVDVVKSRGLSEALDVRPKCQGTKRRSKTSGRHTCRAGRRRLLLFLRKKEREKTPHTAPTELNIQYPIREKKGTHSSARYCITLEKNLNTTRTQASRVILRKAVPASPCLQRHSRAPPATALG